jgi:hypothetical protein
MVDGTGASAETSVYEVGAALLPERWSRCLWLLALMRRPIEIAASMWRKSEPAALEMRVRRLFLPLALACLAWFSAVTGATSLVVEEFYALNTQQREDTIMTVLEFYYENYRADPVASRKADCMAAKHQMQSEDGSPYLVTRIMREMETARTDTAGSRTVEEVVETVVERECAAP